MARPLRIEYPHAFYHVLSRGNEGKAVFKDSSDYDLFFKTLEESPAAQEPVVGDVFGPEFPENFEEGEEDDEEDGDEKPFK